MSSIRQSIQLNRRLLVLVAGLLIVVIVFLGKFFFHQSAENKALRLKILSMSENKKIAKPWSALTSQTSALTAPAQAPVASATQADVPKEEELPLADQDVQKLATTLSTQMKRPRNLDEKALDQNIAIADEIISREPDSYSAYKAKLISLLVKEGKFNQSASEEEVESLLENMAQFNIGSDKMARREAALMANSNVELNQIDDELNALAEEKQSLESRLNTLDANSPELAEANRRLDEIEEKETMLFSNAQAIEQGLASSTDQMVNEDIIEIPFMRMLAKNDYEGVINNAQTFIEQFPGSPSGYYYLMRAMELQGQKAEALSVIQNSQLPPETRNNLLQRLESEGSSDPKNYWQKLSF